MKMRIERALVALSLLLISASASALRLELAPSAHTEVQRDDNIFRVPDEVVVGGAPRVADTLVRYGAGAKLTLNESLQQLELRGEYDRINYAQLDQLDYGRYLIGLQARLAMASTLKLKLDASRERRQENFAYRDDSVAALITVDQAAAELRYAATPRWTGIARAERYATETSRQSSKDSNLEENAGELGLEYSRNNYSSLGVALRQADGRYPNRVVTPGDGREKDYTQQSLVTRAGYTPSGLSDLKVQVAYTQRTHDDAAVPDFHGFTGRLAYTRKFSGISQAQLELYRDLYYVEDANANYVENLGLKASYDYRWSAKLGFLAAMERYESSYKGSPRLNSSGGQPRQDEVFNVRLGASYQPFYRFSILPEYRYERRGSNTVNGGYDFNVFGVDLAYRYGAGR